MIDCKIYISEPMFNNLPENLKKFEEYTYNKKNLDIREFSTIEDIISLIEYSRGGNITLDIYFDENYSMYLGSEFNVCFFNIPSNKYSLIEKLVISEGLFLRKSE